MEPCSTAARNLAQPQAYLATFAHGDLEVQPVVLLWWLDGVAVGVPMADSRSFAEHAVLGRHSCVVCDRSYWQLHTPNCNSWPGSAMAHT
jgi:hypothetical protein